MIAAFVASSKGRSAVGWFLICFFSGFWLGFSSIIFVIVLLTLSNRREAGTRHAAEAVWRRRHHEGFEQERNLNQQFRKHVIKRLDRQDDALGLPPIDDPPPPRVAAPKKEIRALPVVGNGTWFLVIQGKEEGPYPEEKIVAMLEQKEIDSNTYAWSEGMQDWLRIQNIGNFSTLS